MADEMNVRTNRFDELEKERAARQAEREKERLEQAREQGKLDFKAKQDKLLNQILDLEEQYGPDYYLVELLTMFYEASLEMETVMKSMEAVNMAMDCITEAMTFFDTTVQLDKQLWQKASAQSYSWWARHKMKSEMRKAQKNNVGRMKAMVDGMIFKYKMMTDMVGMLKNFAGDIKNAFTKINKPKGKKGAAEPVRPSAAQERIAAARAERGMAPKPAGTSSAPAAGGNDDFSDVL